MGSEVTLINSANPEQAYSVLKKAYECSIYPIGPQWKLKHLRDYCRKDSVLSVYYKHQPVGFVCFLKIDSLTIEILLLAILPQYWRQGLMKQAVLQLLQRYDEVWLEVHEQNIPAKQLYLSLGFEITGRRLNYYGNDGTALMMRYKKS
ncbi:MAG: GNAT family N-acetyltransferase [Bdellovibrionales bacterium]|nr:GNAT family N-acetyltransferase [Bdellovibrionales bacterium]